VKILVRRFVDNLIVKF